MKPGLYRHFKGGRYRVLGTAEHSENAQRFVYYKSLKHGTYWVRPLDMFMGWVTRDGYSGTRFVREPFWKQLLLFWRR